MDDDSLPKSLLEGVVEVACRELGITSLRHRSALLGLADIRGSDLVSVLYRTIQDNYRRGGATANKDRSRENWRWCSLQPQISPHNRSPEVVLERAIASACQRSGRTDWANQIPVASGLIAGARDGRRAIDLVHRRGEGHFEFIELKIASDTPLYAAIEIICYGCIWLLARTDPPNRISELLFAERVDLRVLAPARYYERFELKAIEADLDRQIHILGAEQQLNLSFAFDVAPQTLVRIPPDDDGDLLSAVAARRRLFEYDRRHDVLDPEDQAYPPIR